MTSRRPHILITNDDGITSHGLLALENALTIPGHRDLTAHGLLGTLQAWNLALKRRPSLILVST